MWKDMEGVKAAYAKGTSHSLEGPKEKYKNSIQNNRSPNWHSVWWEV
jgi:hypothetical protein